MVELLELVSAGSTCDRLDVDEEVDMELDEAARVQSSQVLPLSEGHEKLVGL